MADCYLCNAHKFASQEFNAGLGHHDHVTVTDSAEHDHELAEALWHLVIEHPGGDGAANSGWGNNELLNYED